jgi:hypothetical protein
MRNTVVGTFASAADAENIVTLLLERGFEPADIEMRSTEPPRPTAGTSNESWWAWLFGESDDRTHYTDQLGSGGTILAVTADDAATTRVRHLMQAGGAAVETSEGTATVIAPSPHERRFVRVYRGRGSP